jgi:WD40 repeat protein
MSDPRPDPSADPIAELTAVQTKSEFTAALRRLHDRSGKTFREAAQGTGLTFQTVNGYVRGKHLPHARGRNAAMFLRLLRLGYGIEDRAELDAWTAALRRVADAPGPRPVGETVPYPGLRPFQAEEADWFFGREDLVERLRAAVAAGTAGDGPRTVLLTGASGSGKSSLLNVGVIAAAEQDERLSGWRIAQTTPGIDPVGTLSEALKDDTGPCVLVVDQLEELWADGVDPEQRQVYLTLLRTAADGPEPRRFVAMAIRADFYAELLGDRYLSDLADGSQIPVGPMSAEQLAAAIERPARAVNAEVEPRLTELLLHDLAADDVGVAGALPLLALALRDLWSQGRRHSMSAGDYLDSGRLADIVKRTGEAVWAGLTPAEQETGRALLTRMVSVQEGLPLTRRHLSAEQFDDYRRHDPAAEAVARKLVDSRLIVRDEDGMTLVHDVLLRAWPRLLEWIEADRGRLAAHGDLARSVAAWERHGRDHAYLYQARRLVAIEEKLGPVPPPLALAEREFLAGSRRRAARAKRRRQAVVAVLAVLLAASLVSLFTAVEQHSQAAAQAETAERERRDAESRLIATNADGLRRSDPGLAAQLAVAAYQASPTLEARSALLSATATPRSTRMFGTAEAVIERIAVSPDGGLLAAAADSGDLWIWDTTEPRHPELLHSALPGVEGVIRTVRFADGDRLYSAGENDTVYLHDLSEAAEPRLLAAAALPVGGVNFIESNAATGTVAVGGLDGHVYLWDPALTGEPRRLDGPGGSVKSIAITTDGTRMAVATFDRRAAVYDLGAADPTPHLFTEGGSRLATIAYSPDGGLIATGAVDGTVSLWTGGDAPEAVAVLEGPGAWAFSVVFLPGTPYLAVGAGDGLWIWNHESGALADRIPSSGPVPDVAVDPRDGGVYASYTDGEVRRWQLPGTMLTGPTGSVRNLAYLDGGPRLVLAANQGSIWVWDTGKPSAGPERVLTTPDPASPLLAGVAASPDGSHLAVLGLDGRIWLWDTADWDAPPLGLTGLTAEPIQVAFSANGDRLAAVADDGMLALWELGAGTDPAALEQVSSGSAYAVAFSPSGDLLATGAADASVRIWEAPPGSALTPVADLAGPEQAIEHLVFDHDGARLAAASDDGNVYLWRSGDFGGDAAPVVLQGDGGQMQTVAFGPGRPMLAASGLSGSVILWSLDDPDHPQRFAELTASGAGVSAVGFDGTGGVVAGAGDDPTARLWLTDTAAAIAAICDAAGAVLTAEEWETHVPGTPYRPPC